MGNDGMKNTPAKIKAARKLWATGRFSQRTLANKFGVCQQTILRWVDSAYCTKDNTRKRIAEQKKRQNPHFRLKMRQKARAASVGILPIRVVLPM